MRELVEDTGVFFWPLALCSLLASFVIIERLIALRTSAVLPGPLREALTRGDIPAPGNFDGASLGGRVLTFFHERVPSAVQLQAFAQWQVTRLERGFFLLEVIIGAAPLIGLLGTVWGLIQVFGQISPETGLPDTAGFVDGVALALTTTMIGLTIAIPTLAAYAYLQRKVDGHAAELAVALEPLEAQAARPAPAPVPHVTEPRAAENYMPPASTSGASS